MARKSNSESKPAVSASNNSTSSVTKTRRAAASRGSAHRKASSAEPVADAGSSPDPAATESSITNLSAAVEPTLDRDAVARLAYAYWQQRGGKAGNSEEDWLRAEHELSLRNAK